MKSLMRGQHVHDFDRRSGALSALPLDPGKSSWAFSPEFVRIASDGVHFNLQPACHENPAKTLCKFKFTNFRVWSGAKSTNLVTKSKKKKSTDLVDPKQSMLSHIRWLCFSVAHGSFVF